MIDKKNSTELLNKITAIAKKYDFLEIIKKSEELVLKNDRFGVHILFVGGFSAGKSALLNRLMGEDLLRENQAPETTIATELHYGPVQKILGSTMNGEIVDLTTVDNVNIDEYRNVEIYVPNKVIQSLTDFTIVDTPGFDSGIAKHNKALLQYLDQGTGYVLVVDCEKGTIPQSALNFLHEIVNYSSDIRIIINKCDKKIPEDVTAIKNNFKDILESEFDRKFDIVCTSKYDEDAHDKLVELVKAFDPSDLYKRHISLEVEQTRDYLLDNLTLTKQKAVLDVQSIDDEIASREKICKRMVDEIQKQKEKLHSTLHNNTREQILSELTNQLNLNSPNLAQAAKSGNEAFQGRVLEIMRPVLADGFEKYSGSVNKKLQHSVKDYMMTHIPDSRGFTMEQSGLNKLMSSPLLAESGKSMFNVGTGLAKGLKISGVVGVLANVLNPIAGLVITFLPEIIGFFSGMNKDQQMEEQIRGAVIPKIRTTISGQLDGQLAELENEMAEQLENQIRSIVATENEALEHLKQKKETKEAEFEAYIAEIENDISVLRG